MHVPSSSKRNRIRILVASLLIPTLACVATWLPPAAHAAGSTVECMLPGAIHNVGGHPSMGPRHAVQTTPEDCQHRGGEYTVSTEPVASSMPQTAGEDATPVRCQLPRQTRQLGSKARYTTKSRIIRTTASDCQSKQGRVLVAHGKAHT